MSVDINTHGCECCEVHCWLRKRNMFGNVYPSIGSGANEERLNVLFDREDDDESGIYALCPAGLQLLHG